MSGVVRTMNCGLLCRFMGTRFVTSTAHGMVSTVGTHCSASAVSVHVEMHARHVACVVTVRSNTNHVTTYRHSHTLGGFDDCSRDAPSDELDVVFTAAVARWVCPLIMKRTFISVPRSGVRGCHAITPPALAAALFNFCGVKAFVYDSLRAAATSTWCVGNAQGCLTAVFGARHITLSTGARRDSVHVPAGVVAECPTGVPSAYVDTTSSTQNELDEMIVLVCQSAQGFRTRAWGG